MKKSKPYKGMVLFTVLALLSIYFAVVFQFIGFYREHQAQLSQLVHFYEMKTLANLSYRRVSSQEATHAQTLTFNKGRVIFEPHTDEWSFEVSLNTGETRRFYYTPPQLSHTEETSDTGNTENKEESAKELAKQQTTVSETEKTCSTKDDIDE
ncbi:hypothetical protein VL4N_14740 [Vagococcus lutrae]|uniref:hypothetical protein n=1 Tax=Vagococcus lutrae TaxID=81947 RepID=UPI00192868DA|nr:hypothetical protein [Vagococcus lutrae]GEQ62123.1 hypothetical protein VL2N_14590 [Vagococcus lutrae]GEQ64056.1 hypothetical protein VL3N_14980 [Vagococcus lutrae]GEQ65924.1 hypothetical protein VL4N_14740 [Vagococcus lutrae]